MWILATMLQCIGMILGSVALAMLLNGGLWSLCRAIRHPDWAAPGIGLLLLMLLASGLRLGDFLRFAFAFTALMTIPFWIEGRSWRKRWLRDHFSDPLEHQEVATEGTRSY